MNSIDEVNTWMAEAEETLRGDDLGKDVESTTALIKKIASVESDLYQQESKLTQLRETCNGFEKVFSYFILICTIRITNY